MRRLSLVLLLVSFFLEHPRGEIIYPQVAAGGGYKSILIVSNKSDQEWHGQLKAYRRNAEPWNVTWRLADVSVGTQPALGLVIPPDSTRKIEIQGGAAIAVGYLVVQTDPGYSDVSVALSFFYNLLGADDRLQDSTGIPAGESGTRFAVTVETSEDVNTGIAWAPCQPVEPFKLQARLVGVDGQTVLEKELTFDGHDARFFTELFDSVPSRFLGKVILESPKSICVTALRVEIGEGIQLTSTPPSRLTDPPARLNPLELELGTFWFRQHDFFYNTWTVSGKIRNHSSQDATFPQLSFAAYNSKGELVGGEYGYIHGPTRELDGSTVITSSVIRAGDVGYFSFALHPWDTPESFDFVIFAGRFSQTSEPASKVEVSQYQIKDVNGRLRVEAQLQNTGTRIVKLGYITAFLFDDKDRVLAAVLGKADKEQLQPGEKGTFAQDAYIATTPVKRVFFSPDWEEVNSGLQALEPSDDTKVSPEETILLKRRLFLQETGKGTLDPPR